MRCLVVGGTGFLGGAIVDTLTRNDHEVIVLTRGKTFREIPASVRAIQVDRFGDLSNLQSYDFDWVFDTCAFEPEAVERLLQTVGENCRRYVLVSSLSAFGSFSKPGLQESDPVPDATEADLALATNLTDEQRGSATSYGASYGPLKRACEVVAEELLGEKAISLRVGLLVGAGDYSDRLTWWVRRLDQAHGARMRVPAPAPPDRPVQMIDVRDVADFALRCAETELSGLLNVTSQPLPLESVLRAIIEETGSEAQIEWVSEQAILDAKIDPWTDIPLMAPSIPEFKHFLEMSTHKAVALGLKCRPICDTLRPLIEWDRMRRATNLKAGMDETKEALLLN